MRTKLNISLLLGAVVAVILVSSNRADDASDSLEDYKEEREIRSAAVASIVGRDREDTMTCTQRYMCKRKEGTCTKKDKCNGNDVQISKRGCYGECICCIPNRIINSGPENTITSAVPVTNTDIVLTCGENENLKINQFEMITITAGNITTHNLYNDSCSLTLKVGLISEPDEFAKYGMIVKGNINFWDGSPECTNSFISVADTLGTLVKYCGGPNKKIMLSTVEDYIRIEVSIGNNRKTRGHGFNITIEPKFVCGGLIDTETTIQSPYYPHPYPSNISCVWVLQAPSWWYGISLNCPVFSFPRRTSTNRCSDKLINRNEDDDNYCGHELLNNQKKFQGYREIILEFRSDERRNTKYRGFSCQVTFIVEYDPN